MSLDDTFLIDSGSGIELSDMDAVVLDKVNDLDTIIRLSLDAYKSLMGDIGFIDVKDRVKHLEVADKYLSTAKDAMYKKESIIIQRDRLTKTTTKQSATVDDTVDEDVMTRDELYEARRRKMTSIK